MTDFLFLWPGLPYYAARSIRAVIDKGYSVDVVGTKPAVPIVGMEKSLGQTVTWIEDRGQVTLSDLGLKAPKLVFQGGYHIPSISALGAEARAAGAKSILMADNNWTGCARQRFIDPIRHRVFFNKLFDGILVPGHAGVQWAKAMGYRQPIQTAMYGADPNVFFPGEPLTERPKVLFFVGQFIERKNVVRMTKAFSEIADDHPDWSLSVCGGGEQHNVLIRHPAISVEGFVQPTELSERLRHARGLILPSFKEHWGLVVHEAALSGMALALSDTIGAGADLATPDNAVVFKPGNLETIKAALGQLMAWDDSQWRKAEQKSLRLAKSFGPAEFASSVESLAVLLTSEAGK